MSNTFVENKDIKVSCSPFSVYPNEEVILECKDRFEFRYVSVEKILAFDKELLNAVYILRYSTSRQLTEYLNKYRGIEVHQREVSRLLPNYQKQKITIRYSFKSEQRENVTTSKAYALAENGRNILKSTPFGCNWVKTDSYDTENVKKYLARNQFLLKYAESIEDINFKSTVVGVTGDFTYNNNKCHIVPIRRVGFYQNEAVDIIKNLQSDYNYKREDNILVLAEDDENLFEIFKVLVKNKLMNDKIKFTQDNRVLTLDFDEAFIKFNILNVDGKTKVELQQCSLM